MKKALIILVCFSILASLCACTHEAEENPASDFEYEFQMALTNRKLYPEAETVFLTTAADNMYLSSSLVKQVAGLGGDISEFVPACIVPDIMKKIGRDEENDR